MGWQGKPAELVEGLLSAGFLEVEDGRLWIHDWHVWMGRLIEKREANRERMRAVRARARGEVAAPAQIRAPVAPDGNVRQPEAPTGENGVLYVQLTCVARADAREE